MNNSPPSPPPPKLYQADPLLDQDYSWSHVFYAFLQQCLKQQQQGQQTHPVFTKEVCEKLLEYEPDFQDLAENDADAKERQGVYPVQPYYKPV